VKAVAAGDWASTRPTDLGHRFAPRQRRRRDARNRAKSRGEADEIREVVRDWCGAALAGQVDRDHVIGLESRADAFKAMQVGRDDPRRHEQRHRQRDLSGGEPTAPPGHASAGRPAGAATQRESRGPDTKGRQETHAQRDDADQRGHHAKDAVASVCAAGAWRPACARHREGLPVKDELRGDTNESARKSLSDPRLR
jgi:hypothetical protein